jgi:myosin protein heavy chain
LEKAKRQLEAEVADLRTQVEELEDAVQLAEDARLRQEVNQQAARSDFDQQLAQREQEEEERRRLMQKQMRELEVQLEDEKRAKVHRRVDEEKN